MDLQRQPPSMPLLFGRRSGSRLLALRRYPILDRLLRIGNGLLVALRIDPHRLPSFGSRASFSCIPK